MGPVEVLGVALLGEAGAGGDFGFGEVGLEFFDGGGVFGFVGEVVEFVGVVGVVVEFGVAVGVLDVSPALGADGVVAGHLCGEGGLGPGVSGIFEEGDQALAFEAGFFGELGELEEGGIEIDEFDGAGGRGAGGDIGSGDDEGDAGGFFPEGSFFPVHFFADVEAVIRPEDDDGVIGVGALIEGVEEAADAVVGEGGAGEIRGDRFGPEAKAGDIGVVHGGGVEVAGELAAHGREVFEVAGEGGGQGCGIERELVVEFLRGEEGEVGGDEAGGEEEGLVVGLLELIDHPIDDAAVVHFFGGEGDGTEVEDGRFGEAADAFGADDVAHPGPSVAGAVFVPHAFFFLAAVEDFAGGEGAVSVVAKVFGDGDRVFDEGGGAHVLFHVVDAVGEGVGPGEEAGAGGLADGGLAMGVGEIDAALGEAVHVGGLGLGMALEAGDPVAEVIDGDEQEIGRGMVCDGGGRGQAERTEGGGGGECGEEGAHG